MATTKTAISIQTSLIEQADELARQMNISRSRLFARAIEDFVQHYQNRELLEKINAAYEEISDPAEEERLRRMRRGQRRIVEGEW